MRMAASTTAMPRGSRAANSAIDSSSRRTTDGCTSAFNRANWPGGAQRRGGARLAVDEAAVRQNFPAEFPHHGVIGFPAGRQHLVAEFVGLDEKTAAARQYLTHEGLPAGQAAREPHLQHAAALRSAEATVLAMSMAIVRGPTPPGTGEYAPAFSTTSNGSTSPNRTLPFLSHAASFRGESPIMRATSPRSLRRFMPTSITVTPGARHSPVIMAAGPMAATRMSASRQTAARSAVLEWHMVTVACSWSSRNATGLPTMSLRPTTTARLPAMRMPYRLSSS